MVVLLETELVLRDSLLEKLRDDSRRGWKDFVTSVNLLSTPKVEMALIDLSGEDGTRIELLELL